MQARKDSLLDILDEPTLTPGQREQAQKTLTEVKQDITDSRYGADESQLRSLWKKYRQTALITSTGSNPTASHTDPI